jgi:hypothetical protein
MRSADSADKRLSTVKQRAEQVKTLVDPDGRPVIAETKR